MGASPNESYHYITRVCLELVGNWDTFFLQFVVTYIPIAMDVLSPGGILKARYML